MAAAELFPPWMALLMAALRPLDQQAQAPCNLNELEGLLPAHQPLRPAAVLVGLVPRAHGWQVMLTRRTEHLPTHAGQISFPGGRIEAVDRDAVAGALRETHEELGIAPALVRPLGLLDVYGTISAFAVTPVVGIIDPETPMRPDAREVDEVFEVPLRFLLDRANLKREERFFAGRLRGYYVYPYGERYIWGATAGMLVNLMERLDRHGFNPADLDR
ncbi:MAG: CoA pyrophosphatase [Lysobacterales bacterium]